MDLLVSFFEQVDKRNILFIVGALVVVTILSKLIGMLKRLWVTFLRPGKNPRKYGSWVIVTSPTDGIGKGFTIKLSRRKINLMFFGRNPKKLGALAEKLGDKYKNQIKTVMVDFDVDLDEAITDLDIGLLINNVKVSYLYARLFHEVFDELLMNIIKVSVEGTSKMVKVFVPCMLKRRKDAIVHLESGAATFIL